MTFESSALLVMHSATAALRKARAVISIVFRLAEWASVRNRGSRSRRSIVELGRRQLVDHGAAGLSLRAIARDLGMVSSAVYRYVSSRDELLTLLLVDAYSDLADARGSRARHGSRRVE